MLPSDGGTGLFLSPIPVPPGDPAALSRGAATYTGAQGEIERNRSALTAAASQAGGAAWTGTGAAGYVSAANVLAAAYALTSAALARGATALRAYAADLTTAKQTAKQANAAVATSNAAADAMLAAQAAASQAQTAADDAAQTATSAEAQATASPHSPAAKLAADNARSAATDAQSSAVSAQSQLSALTGQYDADHGRALSLCAQAEEQATAAASKAAAGFDAAVSELMGKSPRPVRGGAAGVPGGSAWDAVIGELAGWNDKAGWALNGLGAFGAITLSKAEVGFLKAAETTRVASQTEDATFWAAFERRGSMLQWDRDRLALNAAVKNEGDAADALRVAINTKSGDLLGVVGKAGLGLGMASDVVTFLRPSSTFGSAGEVTDRVMSGLNFAASGLAAGDAMGVGLAGAAMAIPGVDVVVGGVLVGTAVYFAGEYVWGRYGGDITHAAGEAGSWLGHQAESLTKDAGKVLSWL